MEEIIRKSIFCEYSLSHLSTKGYMSMTISPRISTESNNFDRRIICLSKRTASQQYFFTSRVSKTPQLDVFLMFFFFISLEVFSKTSASDKVPNTIGLDVIPPAIVRDTKRHLVINYTINSILKWFYVLLYSQNFL